MSRKWLLRIGFGFLGLLLLALGLLYAEWKYTRTEGEKRRDEVVRKLDAAEPNWRTTALTDERNARIPPPEKNGAEQALKAVKLVPQSFKDWQFQTWTGELKPGVLPYDDDWTEALLVHFDCEQALIEVRKIRHMPDGGFTLVFAEPAPINTSLEKTQKIREAASLLSLDAMMLATLDKPNEAIESVHAGLNLAYALGDEPTLISMLVRMALVAVAKGSAERVLGWTEPKTGLAELQAAMARELAVSRFAIGLRGDRASFYRLMENFDNDAVSYRTLNDQTSSDNIVERMSFRYLKKHLPDQQATFLEIFEKYLEADKLIGPERTAAYSAIKLPPRGIDTMMLNLLLPAVDKVNAAELRTRAHLGTGIAALACERYRIQFGKWPVNLKAIPKSILKEIPLDPYTAQPVLLAKLADGIVLYATGPDLSDDGGLDLNPKGDPGTDIGFRLFDPKHRSQAPPPRPKEIDPFEDDPNAGKEKE